MMQTAADYRSVDQPFRRVRVFVPSYKAQQVARSPTLAGSGRKMRMTSIGEFDLGHDHRPLFDNDDSTRIRAR
jgi:hypothetical protein